MKNKNTFYLLLGRQNLLRPGLFGFVLMFSSYPSLLIEVFTRRKFGERHFSLGSCFTAVLIMLFFMVAVPEWQVPLLRDLGFAVDYAQVRGWNLSKILLVLYAIAVIGIAVYHKREIRKQGQTIDFERFSQSEGVAFPYWYRLYHRLPRWIQRKYPMDEMSLRRFYEPVTAIVLGFVLVLLPFTRSFGMVIMICGIAYYCRSAVKYALGYHYILDKIDEMILTREMKVVFVQYEPFEDHAGVYVPDRAVQHSVRTYTRLWSKR